jgi:hypothetical protein
LKAASVTKLSGTVRHLHQAMGPWENTDILRLKATGTIMGFGLMDAVRKNQTQSPLMPLLEASKLWRLWIKPVQAQET